MSWYSLVTIPVPGLSMPPGVSDTGSLGTSTGYYAMSDHTHASKARKQRVAVSAASYTWVYPTPFGAGVIPICNGIAEVPAGTTDLVNVQLLGTPNNTQCTFQITRYTQGVAGVLGLNAAPLAIQLHLSAFEP